MAFVVATLKISNKYDLILHYKIYYLTFLILSSLVLWPKYEFSKRSLWSIKQIYANRSVQRQAFFSFKVYTRALHNIRFSSLIYGEIATDKFCP